MFQQQILDGIDLHLSEICKSFVGAAKSREVFLVGDMVESKATMFGKGKYFVFCYTEYDKSKHRF